jgi:hypothetical protein
VAPVEEPSHWDVVRAADISGSLAGVAFYSATDGGTLDAGNFYFATDYASVLGEPQETELEALVSPYFQSVAEVTQGKATVEGFGTFFTSAAWMPCISHDDFGVFYMLADPSTANAVYLYSWSVLDGDCGSPLEWLWTSTRITPWAYSFTRGAWVYMAKDDSGNGVWLWDTAVGDWAYYAYECAQ